MSNDSVTFVSGEQRDQIVKLILLREALNEDVVFYGVAASEDMVECAELTFVVVLIVNSMIP